MSDFPENIITQSDLGLLETLLEDGDASYQKVVMESLNMHAAFTDCEKETSVKTEELVSSTDPSQRWHMTYGNSTTGSHPYSEEWEGPYAFKAFLNSNVPCKTSWWYSPQLNKVFLPMNSSLPISFECTWTKSDLFVRALPVFIEADDLHRPVDRCSVHMQEWDESNKDFPFPAHVVRCESIDSCYVEDPVSRRLSVVTPLGVPPPGVNHVVLHYKFVCKTSCMGGMNRRPIQIIFTLEQHTGEVLGRAAIKIRICSCPKRDMRKEEKVAVNADAVKQPRSNLVNIPTAVVTPARSAMLSVKRSLKAVGNPKTKKMKPEKNSLRYLPIFSDEKFFIETACLVRNIWFGKKALLGEPFTTEEKHYLEMYNAIIGDIPHNTTEEERELEPYN